MFRASTSTVTLAVTATVTVMIIITNTITITIAITAMYCGMKVMTMCLEVFETLWASVRGPPLRNPKYESLRCCIDNGRLSRFRVVIYKQPVFARITHS